MFGRKIKDIRIVLPAGSSEAEGNFPRPEIGRVRIREIVRESPVWCPAIAQAEIHFQRDGMDYSLFIDSVRGPGDEPCSDAMRALVSWIIQEARKCNHMRAIWADPDGVPDELLRQFFVCCLAGTGYKAIDIHEAIKQHPVLEEW